MSKIMKFFDSALIDKGFQPYANRLIRSGSSPFTAASFLLIGACVMMMGSIITAIYMGTFAIYMLLFFPMMFVIYGMILACDQIKQTGEFTMNLRDKLSPTRMLSTMILIGVFLFAFPETMVGMFLFYTGWLYWFGLNFMSCTMPNKIIAPSQPSSTTNPWL